jgi:type I restriction enzyme S subunit
MRIPLPPYDEQRRIAAEIERQLAFVEKAKQAANTQLIALDCLKTRHIDDKFSMDSISDCEWISINDSTLKVGSGATPRGGQSAYQKSGIPLIRSQNVHFNTFNPVGLAYINEKQNDELRNTIVQCGDILLNITGASIGRVCVVPDDYCPANVNQHVCIIRMDNRFFSEFVTYYMATAKFQSEIMELQAGATRQALTKEQIQKFKIPLIDKPKQAIFLSKIKEKISNIDHLHNMLYNQLDTINAIPAAILRQAFGGRM